jgi:hypothetical protein
VRGGAAAAPGAAGPTVRPRPGATPAVPAGPRPVLSGASMRGPVPRPPGHQGGEHIYDNRDGEAGAAAGAGQMAFRGRRGSEVRQAVPVQQVPLLLCWFLCKRLRLRAQHIYSQGDTGYIYDKDISMAGGGSARPVVVRIAFSVFLSLSQSLSVFLSLSQSFSVFLSLSQSCCACLLRFHIAVDPL